MSTVTEVIDGIPRSNGTRSLVRREDLLLSRPEPGPVRRFRDIPPLEVVHFPAEYEPVTFAPPRGVYESHDLRIEWQTMNFRQPFYHRNCDVDELSFQVCGERTLMTELGTIEHRTGDFSLIPVGVAHDNFGREEIHLLFYIPAPVRRVHPVVRAAEPVFPPFPDWEPATVTEMLSECLGGPEHDVAVLKSDERLLLEHALQATEAIEVVRCDGTDEGMTWLYQAENVWIGKARLAGVDGTTYRRHRAADEVQYQIAGRRTLVSQAGVVTLEPGDFVRIPLGCAYADIVPDVSEHISVLSARPLPQIAPTSRTAQPVAPELLATMRNGGA